MGADHFLQIFGGLTRTSFLTAQLHRNLYVLKEGTESE